MVFDQNYIQRILSFQPLPVESSPTAAEASILVPIIKKSNPEIILTLRASNLDTHSGQVAFPGGMRDPIDNTLLDTAKRETLEEVGITSDNIEIIGQLTPVYSPYQITVHPYVGLIDPACKLQPCPDEVESIFTVPLTFLLETPPQIYRNTPCFYYGDYKIWGLTAKMIVEFIEIIRA